MACGQGAEGLAINAHSRAVKASPSLFEQRLGLKAKEFDATKASGIRLYKTGRAVRTQQDKWDDFIKEQLGWALEMKKIIRELEL